MDRQGEASALAAGALVAFTFVGAALRSPQGIAAGRRLTTAALLRPLAAWDAVSERLDAHRLALRAPVRVDERPLRVQAAEMWADLERRFLSDGRMLLISTPPVEIGDACLWQGVYAATAGLAYERRPDARSLARAGLALDGLRRVASRGRPLARAVLPLSVAIEPPGRWYHRDARYQWKEDASVDSAAGWLFGALVIAETVPARRREAIDAVQRFADELIAGGFKLRNSDGTPTRFGSAGGDMVNSPVGMLVTLAALNTLARERRGALYVEWRDRFVAEGQHRWAAYASGPSPWVNLTTNHDIAFLGLSSALLSEDDPERAAVYARGLMRLERLTERMDDSFWIYLTDWTLARAPEVAPLLEDGPALREHRLRRRERWLRARRSMLEWHYPYNKLKQRRDPPLPRALEPLPVFERPAADFVWQRSPYERRGWEGVRMSRGRGQAYSPLDFLAAYELGRAIGALSADE